MREWKTLGEKLSSQLRPATFPIAIKFFSHMKDVPEDLRRPKGRIIGCGLFGLARRHGLSLVANMDDIACSAISIFGFIDFSNEFVEWYSDFLGKSSGYAKNKEAAEKSIRKFPRIEYKKYSAIMVSPLEKMEIEPDLIMVYLNPAQVHQLLLGVYKISDEGTIIDYTVGEPVSTCTFGIAKAHNTRELQLVIPGTGDRRHGSTQDDELVAVIPIEKLSDLVEGIEKSRKAIGRRYPVPMNIEITPEIDDYQKALLKFTSLEKKKRR